MDKLKEILIQSEQEIEKEMAKPEVDVFADSVDEGLDLAASELGTDIFNLDYSIISKGSKGIFGIGRTPYHLRVSLLPDDDRYKDIADLNVALTGKSEVAASEDFTLSERSANANGDLIVRIFKTGVHVKSIPPRGNGHPVSLKDAVAIIQKFGVDSFDQNAVKQALASEDEKYIKISDYTPRPEADSVAHMEMTEDEMKVFVTVHPPKSGGRHLMLEDVVKMMKANGVVYGFKELTIAQSLERDNYGTPILAAEGDPAVNGADAQVDYKVKIDKSSVQFKEKGGRVDFKEMDLIENVVTGELLAEKIPAQKGKNGRTVTNRIIPAKDGKDIQVKQGKGTILSDDGMKLFAEINGQVILAGDKVSVEPVYKINGDVSTETGHIVFLGSVVVTGSVQDNYSIKAAGNIEVWGTVQKANLEAEGDIIIHQGIVGKDGAKLESTSGSLYAKFVQQAEVIVEQNVQIAEGIMHCKISAGDSVVCDGKRAQIAGGVIQAGKEIRAKQIGSAANPETVVTAGVHPKISNQLSALKQMVDNSQEKMHKVEQNIKTLSSQEKVQGKKFPDEKRDMLVKMMAAKEKLVRRIQEAEQEMKGLEEFLEQLEQNGKIHVEKDLFTGVTLNIKDATFPCRQDFRSVTCVEENGEIKFLPYEKPDLSEKDWRQRRRQFNNKAVDKE